MARQQDFVIQALNTMRDILDKRMVGIRYLEEDSAQNLFDEIQPMARHVKMMYFGVAANPYRDTFERHILSALYENGKPFCGERYKNQLAGEIASQPESVAKNFVMVLIKLVSAYLLDAKDEFLAGKHAEAQASADEAGYYYECLLEAYLTQCSQKNLRSNAAKAAHAAHKETYELKREAFKWCDAHLSGNEPATDAAQRLIKVIPLKASTATRYVREWKSRFTASV